MAIYVMLDEFLRSARNLAHYLSLQRADLRQIQSAFRALGLSTLVLENLVREGMATRAETTDAAMAQRTECEMLNKGPHLVEAVSFLDQILRRMHRCQNKKLARLGPLKSWQGPKPL